MKHHVEHKPRLLVADDEDSFRMLMARALEDSGFEVTQASDGDEAVLAARERSFDLALLDVRMPKIDGIGVLRMLRSDSPTTDCIMITGYQDVKIAVEAIKLGAKDFLSKPINVEELVQRVRSVLRAHTAEAHIRELQVEFTSKLLHDLLTPLHTLRSAINFLEKEIMGNLTKPQQNVLQSVNGTIKNMDALLNDMIDLSLFESGRVDIEKIPTNLDELIPAICTRFKPQISAKNISLKLRINENVPTVEVDPEKIEQVMDNLLENAITYTPESGSIEVSLSVKNQSPDIAGREFIEVGVSDTGKGIAKSELPFVFDKYKEFLTGKISDQKTTGLGLAICRSIVEAHKGMMSVESEVGKGSTFRFFLPTFSA